MEDLLRALLAEDDDDTAGVDVPGGNARGTRPCANAMDSDAGPVRPDRSSLGGPAGMRRDFRARTAGSRQDPVAGGGDAAVDPTLTTPLAPNEERLLLETVRRMAEEVWKRRSRRSRRWKAGRVDVKATVALSRRTGGVPFRMARRRRRLRRARLLLLLDVSGSVRHAARFLMAMTQAMQRAFSGARAFVFVDRPVEATSLLEGDTPPTAEAWMRACPEVDWMGKSDFGHTFFRMLEEHDHALRKDTLLVILGDARNNRVDPMTWALREMRERVGHLIWLNPEPRARWNTGDSVMQAYAGLCDAVERCERLSDLRRVAERWAHLSARWR